MISTRRGWGGAKGERHLSSHMTMQTGELTSLDADSESVKNISRKSCFSNLPYNVGLTYSRAIVGPTVLPSLGDRVVTPEVVTAVGSAVGVSVGSTTIFDVSVIVGAGVVGLEGSEVAATGAMESLTG